MYIIVNYQLYRQIKVNKEKKIKIPIVVLNSTFKLNCYLHNITAQPNHLVISNYKYGLKKISSSYVSFNYFNHFRKYQVDRKRIKGIYFLPLLLMVDIK